MTRLTIFTAPKPFLDPHIQLIQRNAVRSWKALGEQVEVILVGDEEGIAGAAADLGTGYIAEVDRNPSGVPLISSIFSRARDMSQADLLAYVNADILLLPDFLETALLAAEQKEHFLMVGQRWDLNIREELRFHEGWPAELQERILREGRLHLPYGSDYFIFPKTCFQKIPDFAVGRAGWDNWMLFQARWMGWPLINATGVINIIHQRHDYSHLPGGKPHYRHPDSYANIRLAGGHWAIFTLGDADHHIQQGLVRKRPLDFRSLLREVEIFPVRIRSRWLGKVFYAIFHPQKAYQNVRGRLKK